MMYSVTVDQNNNTIGTGQSWDGSIKYQQDGDQEQYCATDLDCQRCPYFQIRSGYHIRVYDFVIG